MLPDPTPDNCGNDFCTGNARYVDFRTGCRIKDARHPGSPYFIQIALNDSAAVKEIDRHLSALLDNSLGHRFAFDINRLVVIKRF